MGLLCCVNPQSMEQSVSMTTSCNSLGAVRAHVSLDLMVWRAWIILSSVVGEKSGRLCGQKQMASLTMMARDSFVRMQWQR